MSDEKAKKRIVKIEGKYVKLPTDEEIDKILEESLSKVDAREPVPNLKITIDANNNLEILRYVGGFQREALGPVGLCDYCINHDWTCTNCGSTSLETCTGCKNQTEDCGNCDNHYYGTDCSDAKCSNDFQTSS